MKRVVHEKLVRDNIPTIIKASGATVATRQLDDGEYRKELLKKLIEEAKELLASDGSLDERADVAEVLGAIDELFGYTSEIVEATRLEKVQKRGGFSERIYLEYTEE